MSGTPEETAQTTSRTTSATVDQCGLGLLSWALVARQKLLFIIRLRSIATHGKAYLEG